MSMSVAFSTVAVMLLYALPGFLMIKTKLVQSSAISAFAKLLMYVCQPVMIVYMFIRVEFSAKMVIDMLIVLGFMLAGQGLMMLAVFLIFRKKMTDVRYRIYALASAMGNFAFMGLPILEALLPDYPEAIAFSAMGSLSLNIIGWTAGSAIITQNKKYISVKKMIFNPVVLALVVAIPLFVTGFNLPDQVDSIITMLGRMTTPLCMIIMGMRLATSSVKSVFCQPKQYLTVAVKQLLLPAICLLILTLLPIEQNMKATIFIMMCCPVASVVLNFSEMLGEGQETAANLVLLGTTLSTLTIPIMVALL